MTDTFLYAASAGLAFFGLVLFASAVRIGRKHRKRPYERVFFE